MMALTFFTIRCGSGLERATDAVELRLMTVGTFAVAAAAPVGLVRFAFVCAVDGIGLLLRWDGDRLPDAVAVVRVRFLFWICGDLAAGADEVDCAFDWDVDAFVSVRLPVVSVLGESGLAFGEFESCGGCRLSDGCCCCCCCWIC